MVFAGFVRSPFYPGDRSLWRASTALLKMSPEFSSGAEEP